MWRYIFSNFQQWPVNPSLCIHEALILRFYYSFPAHLRCVAAGCNSEAWQNIYMYKLSIYSKTDGVCTWRLFMCLWFLKKDVFDKQMTRWYSPIPADWETKRPFGMTTLSSEFLAQSTMPLRPFMGKLMSVITDTAGSLWMLATTEKQENTDY